MIEEPVTIEEELLILSYEPLYILSSLAAAAETHQVMDTSSGNVETAMEVDALRAGHLDHVPVVGDLPPENMYNKAGRGFPDVSLVGNNYGVWMDMYCSTDFISKMQSKFRLI